LGFLPNDVTFLAIGFRSPNKQTRDIGSLGLGRRRAGEGHLIQAGVAKKKEHRVTIKGLNTSDSRGEDHEYGLALCWLESLDGSWFFRFGKGECEKA